MYRKLGVGLAEKHKLKNCFVSKKIPALDLRRPRFLVKLELRGNNSYLRKV